MLDAALIAGMKMAAINELPTWLKILDITSLHAGVNGNTKPLNISLHQGH